MLQLRSVSYSHDRAMILPAIGMWYTNLFRPINGKGAARRRTAPSKRHSGQAAQARLESIPLQASIRPFTAEIDLSSIAFSALSRLISITFSMPFSPITTGTPT